MKTHPILALTFALLLSGIATQAWAGIAILITNGNWDAAPIWNSTPGGFAPINGNNGENWDAIVNANTVTVMNTGITIESLSFNGGAIQGVNPLTMNAASTWTGGNFATSGGVTNFNGGVAITANGQTISERTVNLAGASSIGSGTLNTASGGVLTNAGTFAINNASALTFGGNGAFNNSGTINKSGAGTATRQVGTFNNTGTVNVDAGIFATTNGGSSTGTFDIDSGAEFRAGGTHTMSATVQIHGSGLFTVLSGTTTFNGANSGSTGNLAIANGGSMTFAAGANFSTSGSFTGADGNMAGAGTATFGGASTWSGGNLQTAGGVTNFNGGVAITANSQDVNARTVNMAGTSSIGSGTLEFFNGGVLANSGTFNINNASTLSFANLSGAPIVTNSGTINKSGAGTATFGSSTAFSNSGTLNVDQGTFTLNSNLSQWTGSTLTGGTWNVSNGASLVFNGGSNIQTIGSAASVKLSGAGSAFAKVTAAVNNNQGAFHLANDRDLTTAGAYTNSGTTRVEDSTTVMTIGAGGGSAYAQTGPSSVTILAGGAMIDTSAFNLNGGALQGTGIIDAPLTAISANATTIAPGASPGTIAVNGSVMLGASNTLAMEVGGLAAGIDYDVLDVNGVLTLGGLLDVDFINLFENSVVPSDIFTIATADSAILGSFSNVASGSRIGTNTSYNFEVWYGAGSPYGANNLVLTQAPEPSRAVLMLAGMAGVMLRRRRN